MFLGSMHASVSPSMAAIAAFKAVSLGHEAIEQVMG